MTLVCVPIMVQDLAPALEDAAAAKEAGADLVEYRIDHVFHGEGDDEGEALVLELVAESPLPCIVTCRPTWEGGDYDGDEMARISLFQRLGTSDHPPRYIDVELAAYTRSANIREKVKLATDPRGRDRHSSLILSIHDFEGRPSDLMRRVTAAWAEERASVVKVAYRARSLRDNLELFDILREAPKPTIALGMGEFGLMSRVLAPKFGGFLTFASLRKQSTTAPGQPTIGELLDMYRFRSIGKDTRVYGVIGWPVAHSMGPLIHNAGFEAVGHDGVYLPLPVVAEDEDSEGSYASFKGTLAALTGETTLGLMGASVTLPHKGNLRHFAKEPGCSIASGIGPDSANTFFVDDGEPTITDTDAPAALACLSDELHSLRGVNVALVGAGGVARAIALGVVSERAVVHVFNRTAERARALADHLSGCLFSNGEDSWSGADLVTAHGVRDLTRVRCDAYINCTPVGMTGGPDPDGLSIPVDDIKPAPETVFFDTVYNPIETPMLKAAKRWGCRTIDGVEMFVRQAALQFELWTGTPAPRELFDRLVRETLS